LDNWNLLAGNSVIRTEQVFGLASLSLRVSGWVLQHPNFIAGIGCAPGGEVLHGVPR